MDDVKTLPQIASLISTAEALPSDSLEDWGPVAEPLGEPVSRLRGRHLQSDEANGLEAGIWECTPGTWRRKVMDAEFCHFLFGRCRFHAESGKTVEIGPGTTIFFPAESRGTWEVLETVRKVFMTVKVKG